MELSITVPTSLAEIKLSDFQKYAKVEKENDNHIFVAQKMVQIFCNVPLLAVTNMRRKDFVQVTSALREVLEQKPELIQTFEHNGKEYGFIPNLDDMSLGEYIDLEEFLKDVSTYHKAMAVLYRPITYKKKTYLIEDYKPNQGEHMKDCPMDVVIGSLVFFYRLGTQLLSVTPKYLRQLVMKNPKMQEVLEKNGVGISMYISLLEKACLNLTGLLHYNLGRR